ncbi:MAG: hypothetical protein M5U26_24795 [Planctomycetota bacterium]|nr:hypothetical protein [Planctomycetota bacterium]
MSSLSTHSVSPIQAGAARAVITPRLGSSIPGYFVDRKAEDVENELEAKALALRQGETTLSFVICDCIALYRETCDEAKRLIAARTGLPAQHVLIAATHTHSGPATVSVFRTEADRAYLAELPGRIADAVALAVRRLEPARIAWSVPRREGILFNRRFRMKDGRVKMNPGVGNPDALEPVGPVDPEIPTLFVEAADGRPLGLLSSFALHYVGGPNTTLSPDYFGVFDRELGRLSGAGRDFVAIMANACSGDVNNIDVRGPRPEGAIFEQACRVGRAVAEEVFRAWRSADFETGVPLAARQTERAWKRRVPSRADAEVLERENVSRGHHDAYARERRLLEAYPAEHRTVLQAFRIGSGAIATLPGEMFCRLGLDLREASPFKPTAVIELANDYAGYCPTRLGHEHGGYETWLARSSFLESGAGEALVEADLSLLRDLQRA